MPAVASEGGGPKVGEPPNSSSRRRSLPRSHPNRHPDAGRDRRQLRHALVRRRHSAGAGCGQCQPSSKRPLAWMPASAGMTGEGRGYRLRRHDGRGRAAGAGITGLGSRELGEGPQSTRTTIRSRQDGRGKALRSGGKEEATRRVPLQRHPDAGAASSSITLSRRRSRPCQVTPRGLPAREARGAGMPPSGQPDTSSARCWRPPLPLAAAGSATLPGPMSRGEDPASHSACGAGAGSASRPRR